MSDEASASAPLIIDRGRPTVLLTVEGPGGRRASAPFLVDTGGGGSIVPGEVAAELHIEMGDPFHEEPGLCPAEGFALHLGSLQLSLDPERTFVAPDRRDGLLPGHVLASCDVVVDYPKRCITLSKARLPADGDPLHVDVHPRTGFPRIAVNVGGEAVGMLLDTGAPYSMASRSVMEGWLDRFPEWPHSIGARGLASMGVPGEDEALMLTVPEVTWGPLVLSEVGFVSRPPGTFERWMTGMMTGPVVGALASNALSAYRLHIAFSEGVAYLERES